MRQAFAGNWKWVVPPINGFLSPCYMKLNKMTEYTVLPQYVYAPAFKVHAKRLQVRPSKSPHWIAPHTAGPRSCVLLGTRATELSTRLRLCAGDVELMLRGAVQAHKLGATRSVASEARVQACRRLFFNPYLVRFLGLARRIARRLRPPLVIAYATVTGTTRNYALRLANLLSSSFAVELMNVEEYSSEALKRAAAVVQLTSTYGSGAPPTTARKWLTYLTTTEAKQVGFRACLPDSVTTFRSPPAFQRDEWQVCSLCWLHQLALRTAAHSAPSVQSAAVPAVPPACDSAECVVRALELRWWGSHRRSRASRGRRWALAARSTPGSARRRTSSRRSRPRRACAACCASASATPRVMRRRTSVGGCPRCCTRSGTRDCSS